MKEQRSGPGLVTVLALIMVAMLTMRCESQEKAASESMGEAPFELLELERFPSVVKLVINRTQGTIRAVPPNVVICREEAACPEDQFEWRIQGGLEESERLVIRGARQVCFEWSELVVTPPSNTARSGRYLEDCEADDKYGFFWPYVIELYSDGERIAESDPSGIFRHR